MNAEEYKLDRFHKTPIRFTLRRYLRRAFSVKTFSPDVYLIHKRYTTLKENEIQDNARDQIVYEYGIL